MVDRTKLAFYSNDPIDKIVGSLENSIEVSAFGSGSITTSHGFSFTPLFYPKSSLDSGFVVAYDELGSAPDSVDYSLAVQTDGDDTFIFYSNFTGSTITIYYRILYFIPPDVDADLPAAYVDTFQFNSKYNYPKILYEGAVNSGSGTVSHNLGYRPQVEAWFIRSSDGNCLISNFSFPEDPGGYDSAEVQVTTSDVIFHQSQSAFGQASKHYYKIYADKL